MRQEGSQLHRGAARSASRYAGRRVKSRSVSPLAVAAAILMVLLLLAAAFFLSRAFFGRNAETESRASSITSDSSSGSLFIRTVGDTTGTNLVSASAGGLGDGGSYLYPVSTADCRTWYYAGNVTGGLVTEYKTAEVNASTGRYYDATEGANKTAFLRTDFLLYSEGGAFDVYLDPSNPLTVSYDGDRRLLDAIRVGVCRGNELLFVYAPVMESGVGNSEYSDADIFYCIRNGSLMEVLGETPEDSVYLLCTEDELSYLPYVAENENAAPLCRTDEEGTVLSVYVWLEGTDAQTIRGYTDGETQSPLSVHLTYLGSEVAQ